MNTLASTTPPIAMRGSGYYSEPTAGAEAVIDAAGDLAVEAIADMRLSNAQAFAVADFGAADGGTSLDLMHRIVTAVRAKNADQPVSITYTDLPHNDFSILFRRLHGLLGASGRNCLASIDHLYTFASGTDSTFFGALDPARALPDRQAIVDRFYAAYHEDVAAAPQGHGMDYVHCFMVITKAP